MAKLSELPPYEVIRERAKDANEKFPSSFCLKGKARCCIRDVPITPADAQFLYEGFRSGQIPDAVRQGALKNMSDQTRGNRCPFLGEDNQCTIYDHRPLVCIVFGLGGQPRTREIALQLEEAMKIQQATGVEQYISRESIQVYMCPSCIEESPSGPDLSLSVVEATTAIALYLNADDVTREFLPDFVKRELGG